MTVASTTNRKTYTGDNVSTSFATSPVIFYLTSNLQVRVTVIATGVSTLLTENTHYTVSGGATTGATGTVNLAGGSSPHGALLSTEKLVILRVLPLTQATDLVENSNSSAEVIEAALDKLTDIDQQIQEQADRAFRLSSGDTSGSSTELPDSSVRAGRLLGFDALGALTTYVLQAATSLIDLAASTGSALIGFIQAGTGAVLRTLQSKLRDTVNVKDFGAVAGTNSTAVIQAAIDALTAGQTLRIDEAYLTSGLTITNKTDIRIVGKGSLTLSAAASNAMIFKLVGTCDNIVIEGLKLVGENNAAYTQIGIGNFGGQTISNVWFVRNKISQINNGISMTAEGGGSYTRGWALFNTIKDCPGTSAGQGTGIHNGTTTYCTVAWNVVDNASRNSYYQASGTDTGNVWAYNKAVNHRSTVFTGGVAPAMNILRSTGVLVAYNTIENCYDGGMLVQHESSSSSICKDIELVGNTFRNRKNAVSNLYIGESAVPSGFETTHVRVLGNKFFSDESVAGAGSAEMTIYNGRLLEISNNTFRKTNVAAAAVFVVYGLDAAINITADFTDCTSHQNRFIAEGSVLTDVSAFSCGAKVSATLLSTHRFDNRDFTNIVYPVRHSLATPTNPNLMVIADHRAYASTGASVGAGTTAGKARTNAAVRILYSRTSASAGSTDNLWDLTAVSTGVSQFRKVLLCLQDAASAVIVVGEIAATQAAAKLPSIPDARWAALGVVEISASYSGGALGGMTFYDVIGMYEA